MCVKVEHALNTLYDRLFIFYLSFLVWPHLNRLISRPPSSINLIKRKMCQNVGSRLDRNPNSRCNIFFHCTFLSNFLHINTRYYYDTLNVTIRFSFSRKTSATISKN